MYLFEDHIKIFQKNMFKWACLSFNFATFKTYFIATFISLLLLQSLSFMVLLFYFCSKVFLLLFYFCYKCPNPEFQSLTIFFLHLWHDLSNEWNKYEQFQYLLYYVKVAYNHVQKCTKNYSCCTILPKRNKATPKKFFAKTTFSIKAFQKFSCNAYASTVGHLLAIKLEFKNIVYKGLFVTSSYTVKRVQVWAERNLTLKGCFILLKLWINNWL